MTSTSAPSNLGPGPVPTASAVRTASRRRADALTGVLLRGIVAAAAAAAIVFWWTTTPDDATASAGTAVTSVAELAGLVLGVLVCAQVLLVARVPWFERAVGLDRLVTWHRTLGATVLLLLATHVVLMVGGQSLTTSENPWSALWSLNRAVPDLLWALVGGVLFLAVAATSARVTRRHLPYEAWYATHLGTYLAIYLTFWHQVRGGAHLFASPTARTLWYAMYLATAACVLVWRVGLPLVRQARGVARVERVVVEADGVTSVWLGGRAVERLRAQAGQFVLVRFLVRGHLGTAHPYSLSTVPDGARVRLTVGALGDHSGRVGTLAPGTRVVVEGPYGRFTADRARHHGVLLVAGGAGIGPVRAVAEELWRRGHDVVVLHRARSERVLALAGELRDVPGLRYVPLVGRRAELGHDPLATGSVKALVPDVARRDVFLCGPASLCRDVERTVRSLGVPRSAVHYDELSFEEQR